MSGRGLLSGGTPLSSRSQSRARTRAHARTRKAHTRRVASYGSRSHARPSHSPHVHRPARPVWPGCPSSRARLGRRPRHAAPTGPAPPLGGPGSSCAANATPAVPGAAGRPRNLHDVTRPDRRKEQAPRSCKMQEKVPCPALAGRAADAAQRLRVRPDRPAPANRAPGFAAGRRSWVSVVAQTSGVWGAQRGAATWPPGASPAHRPDGSFQMSQSVGREQAFVRRAPEPRAAWGMIDRQRNRASVGWEPGPPADSEHGSSPQRD